MIHYLKTWPVYYQSTKLGLKTFELRKNDRNYQVGDVLCLQEYDPEKEEYTGDEMLLKVPYMLSNPTFVPDGYVIMSTVRIDDKVKDSDGFEYDYRLGEEDGVH